jgi:hypothetical protein
VRHTIRFADGPADVVVRTSETASLDGLDHVVADLLANARYMPGMTLLLDHSRLDWTDLRPEDLVRRLHVALKQADLIGPSRIAVVSSDARMASAHTVRADEPAWRAFASVDEALAWLGAGGPPRDPGGSRP